ncbi:sortase family protein [Streptomyces sp. Ag109_G2-6]|uniref:sortase domain-containing protein n=1 Tax=Streptomyces sp. Ag109_G2-6 TaxID=2485154 RepID=UPI000F509030|nr:sortase [Streptomyces sp. Ag109_G2-6]RPF41123.1 sortase family protein [Streptomyces sp. Ag109_G2-6]
MPPTPTPPTPTRTPNRTPAPIPRTLAATALTLTAAALALTACGTASATKLPPAPKITPTAAAPAPSPALALERSRPTGLRIEAAGVDAHRMLALKTDPATGELNVPDPDTEADTPGWWTQGATPGEKGVSVLVAHFDTKHGPALMKDVAKIGLGDLVEVPREDGSTARFKIREIEDVNKKDFPTQKVYADTARPELRLLTCGGDIENGHRTNNVILYADLVA